MDRAGGDLASAGLVVAAAELGSGAAAADVAAVGRIDAGLFEARQFGGRVDRRGCGGEGFCVCARVFGAGSDRARSVASGADSSRRGRSISCTGWRLDGGGDWIRLADQ